MATTEPMAPEMTEVKYQIPMRAFSGNQLKIKLNNRLHKVPTKRQSWVASKTIKLAITNFIFYLSPTSRSSVWERSDQ